jgi:hypothetical protein
VLAAPIPLIPPNVGRFEKPWLFVGAFPLPAPTMPRHARRRLTGAFPAKGAPAAARPARPPKRAVWRAFQGIERGDAPSSCVKIEASPELAVMLKPKRK